MIYHTVSKPLLVVVIVQVLLNGHNWARTEIGIKGKNITFSFSNHSLQPVKSIGLYKDDNKIEECIKDGHICSSKKLTCHFDKNSLEVNFCLGNLTAADTGHYWVTLFFTDLKLLKSKEIAFILQSDNNATESSTFTNNNVTAGVTESPSKQTSFFPGLVGIAVLGVLSIALLMGLLIWFCWTDKRNRERDKQEDVTSKPHESGGASTAMPVYSVEYGVLSFNNRPSGLACHGGEGNAVRPSDTVEYAAIFFPPKKKVANGR
ncbi:hypothetical protein UPYG_G00039410 [Umbra pygmaea]|uniref:Uncharacterized protein n=1 Tax=Umbra pygmaea TaxID=75934 RepID=A0ABD0XSG2_UMBPY